MSLKGKDGQQIDFRTWWAALHGAVDKWLEDAEDVEIPDFEETVAEYRIFQAKEIKKIEARSERKSRKIMLDLDIPEPKSLEKVNTLDSGIGMGSPTDMEEYEFAT